MNSDYKSKIIYSLHLLATKYNIFIYIVKIRIRKTLTIKLRFERIYAIIEEKRIGMEFTKKTQKTPTKEIIKAKQIKEEFEEEYYATKDFR